MSTQYSVEKTSTFEGWRLKYNQLALDFDEAVSGVDFLTVDNLAGGSEAYDLPYFQEQASGEFSLVAGIDPSSTVNRGVNSIDFQFSRQNDTEVSSGAFSVLIGGENNTAASDHSTIVNSSSSSILGNSSFSAILGGANSEIDGSEFSAIVGNLNEIVESRSSFISGQLNKIGSTNSGSASSIESSIIGGQSNTIVGEFHTILGGNSNSIDTPGGVRGCIVSGQINTISGSSDFSFIVGGNNNNLTDSARSSIISSASSTMTNGNRSTIISGFQSSISDFAINSVSIGQHTEITHSNSMVIGTGDETGGPKLASTQVNELVLGFLNGVHVYGSPDETTAGSIEIHGASSEVILASPNGTRYSITVDNSGNLTTAAV